MGFVFNLVRAFLEERTNINGEILLKNGFFNSYRDIMRIKPFFVLYFFMCSWY